MIVTAVAGNTIIFDSGLSGGVIDVSVNGTLIVDTFLTISGTVPITISGNNLVRVMEIAPSIQVNLFSLTIADGNSTVLDCLQGLGTFSCGGAIRVVSNSEVTVTQVLFVNNAAQLGGAIRLQDSRLNVHSRPIL